MTELQAVLTEIALIDRKSDGICRELHRRVGAFNVMSCYGWQLAWDRCPDLWARRQALGPSRWGAMDRRDAILAKQKRAAERLERAKYRTELKKCQSCGEYSRVAA